MTKKKDNEVKSPAGEPREIPVGSSEQETSGDEAAAAANGVGERSIEAELRDKCAQLEARVAELDDQRLRALAELDNYKKRMARQFEDTVRSANDRLLVELLEVVDNFERALAHGRAASESAENNSEAFREGTELIYNQLTNLLAKYGVRRMEAVGQKFDPGLHEALLQIDSDEHDAGIVAQEITHGYLIDDRVLRHSRVAVSRGKARSEGQS